jgi:hypothetical protein
MVVQTEFPFVLPKGYTDEHGIIHREGSMRLATALDEILPLRDPRVRENEAYLVIILLSRVITRLGTLANITPTIIGDLFAADLNFLQDLYQRINDLDMPHVQVCCPNCGHEFEEAIPLLGEY